jgi:hypothetical protein
MKNFNSTIRQTCHALRTFINNYAHTGNTDAAVYTRYIDNLERTVNHIECRAKYGDAFYALYLQISKGATPTAIRENIRVMRTRGFISVETASALYHIATDMETSVEIDESLLFPELSSPDSYSAEKIYDLLESLSGGSLKPTTLPDFSKSSRRECLKFMKKHKITPKLVGEYSLSELREQIKKFAADSSV